MTDEEIELAHARIHRDKMRFRRACEVMRDTSPDKKMTLYQAQYACTWMARAVGLSNSEFADRVLDAAGLAAYYHLADAIPLARPSIP